MREHRGGPIDPRAAYPAQGLRHVDRVAHLVRSILPDARMECTRDVYQLIDLGQGGLVVVVTPEAVEIRLPTVEWTSGYAGSVASSRLWKRAVMGSRDDGETELRLAELIAAGRRQRNREIRPCGVCRRPTPPEHAHTIDGRRVCHGCAETQMGVVH
jgi:hypothetical protein